MVFLDGWGNKSCFFSWQDAPLLEHVLTTAKNSSLRGVLTIIPAGDEERSKINWKCNCHTVYNDNPERGIGYSLALGVRQIPRTADAVIILLGDQPELTWDDIERVILRFSGTCYRKSRSFESNYSNAIYR